MKSVQQAGKILVIDDDPVLVEIAKMALTREGYEVMTAKDGRQGLEVLQENEFDCILVDVMMPHMDGVEFVRQCREQQGVTIPIIVLSAMGSPDIQEKLVSVGATKYLHKPVKVETLKEAIKELM